MGFSLVGNSGDQTTQTTVTTNNLSASQNPQLDLQGSGPGAFAVNISPLAQQGSVGEIDPSISDYYAPVNITSSGDNLGDSALAAFQNIATTTAGIQTPAATGTAAAASPTLSSLLSGNAIYWILAGIVILFFAHHK
jgi:hypothetical protein